MLTYEYISFYSYPPKWGSYDMCSLINNSTLKKRKQYIMSVFYAMK